MDVTGLQELIEEAEAMDTSIYTEGSKAVLAEAIAKAKAAAEAAESEEAVQAAMDTLTEAMNSMEEKYINPFEDVEEGKWYYDAVEWGVKNKIVNGLTATTFGPKVSCTRGQIVTLIWRAVGEPKAENPVNKFADVKEGKYYYEAVLWAVEEGIVNGLTDTSFGPEETCTRAQMATFLYRYVGEPNMDDVVSPFIDVEAGKWYSDAAVWASLDGVINGYEGGIFAPKDIVTRDQTVTMLYRFFTGE